MNKNNMAEDKNYSQEIINLVVARLTSLPSNVELSVGNEGSFSINDLIERVKNGDKDEIGREIIEMQLSYIRSFKELTAE